MKTTFKTTILGFGNNAGIEVPTESLILLGGGKRAQVIVTIGNYSFKNTLGNMSNMTLISFSKAHRKASGLSSGDKVIVTLELDPGLRNVDIPLELKSALDMKYLTKQFDQLSYSKRKEFSRQVTDAKTVETKIRRVEKIIQQLLAI